MKGDAVRRRAQVVGRPRCSAPGSFERLATPVHRRRDHLGRVDRHQLGHDRRRARRPTGLRDSSRRARSQSESGSAPPVAILCSRRIWSGVAQLRRYSFGAAFSRPDGADIGRPRPTSPYLALLPCRARRLTGSDVGASPVVELRDARRRYTARVPAGRSSALDLVVEQASRRWVAQRGGRWRSTARAN